MLNFEFSNSHDDLLADHDDLIIFYKLLLGIKFVFGQFGRVLKCSKISGRVVRFLKGARAGLRVEKLHDPVSTLMTSSLSSS